ncbi:MAG TPA: FkbM family methyltransferase [Hyphomicrobiaceae bacterium]|nr:FkbM family methyltransferase [Hyphomicrobiaceae bacterium]
MHLSYAQRLEDYHLDLLFADCQTGFYVDVGAGHPVADNVTFWFYLKGWRGLVIEPQQRLADLYPHIRPRDIAVCGLAGRHDGEADFHVVDRLHGLSTALASHAQAAAALGTTFTTVKAPVRTLTSLCAEHGIEAVDFLKIDVEGAEADVLAGADFARVRPRVVVIEAAAPGSAADDWRTWEPALLAARYRFAFFDGLNRFYVAEECAELVRRLPPEPAPWDRVLHLWDFGRALERPDHFDHALARRLVEGFLAALPTLDFDLLARLLSRATDGTPPPEESGEAVAAMLFGTAEHPGRSPAPSPGTNRDQLIRRLMDSDRFRAALGRIASHYDGGHLPQ